MMNLKVKIHNKVFKNKLVQGCTFTEEYTETLDSGNIILAQVKKIKNLQPYDDVYIYDGDFKGFDKKGNIIGNCTFYKHFLVDSFTEERLNLQSNIYKYKIQLFSETKGLETVQLPNISVTQPLNVNKKISIYDYMNQFINMYSPRIKVAIDVENQKWEYKPKYKLSEQWVDLLDEGEGVNRKTMKDIFAHSYTPDFTLNNPNLKDVLAKLMIVKDRIPVVYNNVIYAMDITKRRNKFDFDKGQINFISASNSSSNYADNLKRTYLDALSQDRTCKMVEYLGFRNKDTALMKLSDLRIETSFPIYKINKIYMCYYKKGNLVDLNNNILENKKAFLCKQDITPLVKLNSERNLLIKDWDDFEEKSDVNYTINQLAKYKMATIGYDIGSNHISGWGEKYSYTKGWWKTEKTYLENIFTIIDKEYPYGIYDFGYITKNIASVGEKFQVISGTLDNVVSPYSNNTLKLKGFFFEVEYDAFYNGTVIHTKDLAIGDTMMLDNPSSSLSLLEMDGLAQKEKINRFGNKNYTIPARYTDFKEIQGLGDYYDDDENEADIIIYRKEYSINGNVINCTYQGMKDYVLKNYFTEVYAKHRPYSLMSYGESITRAENRKVMFFLSKNKKYYENQNIINFKDFNNNQYIDKIFTFFKKNINIDSINNLRYPNKINYGYLELKSPVYDKDGNIVKNDDGTDKYEFKNYASDLNAFVNGNSMCFNMKMIDNVSMGVYVKKAMPFENNENFNPFKDFKDPEDDYTGTLQTWYMTTDDIETGFAKEIGFYVGHDDEEKSFLDTVIDIKENKEISFGKDGNYLQNIDNNIEINLNADDKDGYTIVQKDSYILIKLPINSKINIYTRKNVTNYQVEYYLDNEIKNETVFDKDKFSYETKEETTFKITFLDVTHINSIEIKYGKAIEIDEIYNKKLFTLPKIEKENFNLTNIIGNRFEINKDNKEIIDMTYQFEPITDDDNIMFSPWMMKLSDLIGNYNKFENNEEVEDAEYNNYMLEMICTTSEARSSNDDNKLTMILSIKKENLSYFEVGEKLGGNLVFDKLDNKFDNFVGGEIYYSFKPKEITKIIYLKEDGTETEIYNENENLILKSMTIKGLQIVKNKKALWGKEVSYEDEEVEIDFVNLLISSPYEISAIDWGRISDDVFYLSNVQYKAYKEPFGDNLITNPRSEWITPIRYNNNKKNFYGYSVNNGKFFYPWDSSSSGTNELFSENNADFYDIPLASSSGDIISGEIKKYIYARNMFLILDDEPLKKNLVYEEYKCLQENEVLAFLEEGKRKDFLGKIHNCKTLKPEYYFKVDYEDNVPYLSIVLPVIDKPYQSVQLWYLDNIENGVEPDFSKASYKFVFGINVSQEELDKNESKIYISELSTLNKKVYDENYNLIGHVTDFENDKNISETFTINSTRKDNTLYLNMSYDERMFSTYISKYNIEAYVETIYQGEYIMANFDYYPHFIKDEYGEWLVLKSNGDYEFLPHIYLKRNDDHFECQLELQYPNENYEYTYIDFSFVNSEIYIGKKIYGNQHYTTFEEDEAE